MPQMSPMMWLIFPVVMMMMNIMFVIMNASEEVSVNLADGLITEIEVNVKW